MIEGASIALWVAVWVAVTAPAGAADDRLAPNKVKPINVEAETVEYRGKPALRIREVPGAAVEADTMAVIPGLKLGNGTIEVELAGTPRADAFEGARGFVGIAFRVQEDPLRYECFYLRPTNGRAESQLRRNHSTQYVSHPEFPWHRLRQESPGLYESYVDLVPGEWTPVKIVVSGTDARLFVHGATQPSLVVKDLKLGEAPGGVALWIGAGTEGHFADLRVTPQETDHGRAIALPGRPSPFDARGPTLAGARLRRVGGAARPGPWANHGVEALRQERPMIPRRAGRALPFEGHGADR